MFGSGDSLPPIATDLSIPARFHQIVQHRPDRPAVVDGAQRITYAVLDAWSERIAQTIAGAVGDQPQPIALYFGQGIPVIAAMIGVLKAGHFYAVLDTAMPENRVHAVLDNLHSGYLLTDGVSKTDQPGMKVVMCPEQPALLLAAGDRCVPAADALAAIHYTSGATGQPKGVMVDHAMLLHRASQLNELEPVSPHDVVAGLFSPAYSSAAADIYGALLNGATLALYRPAQQSVGDLRDWLSASQVTMLHLHSGILRQLLDVLPAGFRFEHLRYVRPSGRTRVDEGRRLRRHLPPDAVVIHQLTSSETTAVTRLAIRGDVELAGEILPVGYPIEPEEVTLVGADGQPIVGEGDGELVMRSRYLARGYWNQPELTAQRFQVDRADPRCRIFRMGDLVRRRADGLFDLLGRNDQQVKIRGYTVNLEAVEAALARLPGVQETAVVAQSTRHDTVLVAYICMAAAGFSSTLLRTALAQELPAYMVPARFICMDALPRHANGKVDRASLPPPGRSRPELAAPFVSPRSELEQQIAGIWTDLLEMDEVGMEDNFFELGGDSILAMRMVLAAEQATGGHVPPDYFRSPTIAALAQLCAVESESDSAQPSDAAGSVRWAGPALVQRRQPRGKRPSAVSLFRWTIRKRLLRLGYWEGIDWLNFVGQPLLADRLFRTEQGQLRELAIELGGQRTIDESVMRASIIGNAIRGVFRASKLRQNIVNGDVVAAMQQAPERFWRDIAAAVAAGGERSGRRLYQLDGLEHLLHAHRQGRGIILLTYHNTGSVLTDGILAHLTSLGRVPTLSLERALTIAEQDEEGDDAEAGQVASYWAAAHSLQAQRILRAGGVVRISNDMNYGGPNSISRTIGQRRFRLKPGFADLALTSGAAIVPVYSYFDHTGCVYLKALPALSMLAAPSPRAAQVHHLLDLYVDFLETAWRAHPESLGWGLLARYHRCPMIDSWGGESPNL